MKILELAEFYSEQGGGVRTYIEQKFDAAKLAGHELCVIAPGGRDDVIEREGGKLIWVKSPAIPVDKRYHLFWSKKPIDEIVQREKPDFIEGSSPWRGGWIAGRQSSDIPKALVVHQDPVSTYPKTVFRDLASEGKIDRAFRWFYRYYGRMQSLYDASIVSSAWLCDRLTRVGMERPMIVPFGVNRSEFSDMKPSEDKRREMLRQCGVDDPNGKLLISASRYHPEKRVPMMIEAVKRASQRRPLGLYLIGDGPSRKKIFQLAEETPGVHAAGFVNDREEIARMLASADAYIHGCPTEPFGIVIGEALCSGLPQIVPNAGGAAEMPSPDCAEFYQPDDPDACAAAIHRLFMRDQEKLREAAIKISQEIGGMAQHYRALFSLYENIADKKNALKPYGGAAPKQSDVAVREQVA